jgi:DNA replication protein DnaC
VVSRSGGCDRCDGSGFVRDAVNGREWSRRCSCRSGPSASTEPGDIARLPPACRDYTFGNFVARTRAAQSAYSTALRYCERFGSTGWREGLGLLLWGPTKTGKTHLAVAVLTELISNHGISGRFWDFAGLLNEITRSYGGSSTIETAPLQAAIDVDILVLDDLGSKKMTDWADDTLFNILNVRYMMRRPTLITTPYDDVDREVAREAHAMRRREFLIERIGERLRSRLLEMCVFVPTQTREERETGRPKRAPSTLVGLRRSKGPR